MKTDLSFRMQIFIQASAEEIWEALTTSELLSQWWDRIREADWRVGGLVVLEAGSGAKIDCEVLEIEPNRRLVTTFDCDAYPEHPPTRVTWEIESVEGGCLLRLIHDEFPSPDMGLDDVCQHWPTMIADLKRVLEDGTDN
jgi:uncharacterized protein YndB with AHSA1/START domain